MLGVKSFRISSWLFLSIWIIQFTYLLDFSYAFIPFSYNTHTSILKHDFHKSYTKQKSYRYKYFKRNHFPFCSTHPVPFYIKVQEINEENENDNSYFWTRTRSKEDIIQFISNVLPSQTNSQLRDVEVLSNDPPLIVIHNFISHQSCNDIIDAAIKQGGLIRSSLGATKEESNERTSSNTVSFCSHI